MADSLKCISARKKEKRREKEEGNNEINDFSSVARKRTEFWWQKLASPPRLIKSKNERRYRCAFLVSEF